MDIKNKLRRPFILALAMHLTLLGLFALSALYKPAPKEQPPAPEIIHATMIDLSTLPTKVEKDNTEAEKQAEAEAREKEDAEEAAKADAAKAKAEADALAKAEAAKQAKAEAAAAAQVKAEAAKAKAE